MRRLLAYISLLLSLAGSLLATERFMGSSGNDANTCAQSTSSLTPKKTFNSAFACMAAVDTLTLLDGTYTQSGNGRIAKMDGITGSGTSAPDGVPPNGTSTSNMTVVQAQNPGQVVLQGSDASFDGTNLWLGNTTTKQSYVKFIGIKFDRGENYLYNTSYIFLKQCAFVSHTQSVNSKSLVMGTSDGDWGNSYNLIEDCWIWGQERYVLMAARSDHIVFRRVIVRQDGCSNASGCGSNPGGYMGGTTSYNSSYVSWQNVLVVDNLLGPNGYCCQGDFNGTYHASADGGHAHNPFGQLEWLGSISLNSKLGGIYPIDGEALPGGVLLNPTSTVTNVSVYAQSGAGLPFDAFGDNAQQILIDGMTLNGATTANELVYVGNTFATSYLRDFIATGSSNNVGVSSAITPSYVDVNGTFSGGNYNQSACVTGCKTTNPLSDGSPASLKYITRIEVGSVLKGTGSGGADYGANIVYKYGCDGCFYGDANFDSLTANALLPYPNQAQIKTDMCTTPGIVRGFCGDTSLTHYIQNYLGNGDPSSPIVSLSPASLSFGSINVGASSATQAVTLTNTGGAALTITSIVASGPGADAEYTQTNNCPGSLGAGLNCTITVTFSPTSAGSRAGTVVITDSASDSPQSVALSGIGVTVPAAGNSTLGSGTFNNATIQ